MAQGNARWVVLPVEIATLHSLYGVGGWLYLVALGSVVAPLRIAFTLGPVYADIDYGSLHPMLLGFIAAELAVNAIIALWSLGNLLLLFTKHRLFPTSLAALMATSAVFVPLDAVATKTVMDLIGQPMPWDQVFDPDTAREVARAIIGAAIWIPYALISRRVNVTYLNRVRAEDPIIREKAAEIF